MGIQEPCKAELEPGSEGIALSWMNEWFIRRLAQAAQNTAMRQTHQ